MAKRILQRMQERIRKRLYVMTLHAEEEMDSDSLTIFDVESVILTGEVIELQRDRKTRERKYLVRGNTLERARTAVVVTKFGATDKLVILTVYGE
ncbi:MAG TPA: DUF4258 domain-containing protein [Thermoanaerobaculia bacterium]|nr:DUF4258 domain-containing protein [Thermoanaerobaculia bacterium]